MLSTLLVYFFMARYKSSSGEYRFYVGIRFRRTPRSNERREKCKLQNGTTYLPPSAVHCLCDPREDLQRFRSPAISFCRRRRRFFFIVHRSRSCSFRLHSTSQLLAFDDQRPQKREKFKRKSFPIRKSLISSQSFPFKYRY